MDGLEWHERAGGIIKKTSTWKQFGRQVWKLRLTRREQQTYTYRLVYNLTDGKTHEVGPVETDNPTVLIEDPFSSNRLTVKLKPVGIKWDKVELVLVKLEYTDPENRLNKSQEFNFDKDDPQENGGTSY